MHAALRLYPPESVRRPVVPAGVAHKGIALGTKRARARLSRERALAQREFQPRIATRGVSSYPPSTSLANCPDFVSAQQSRRHTTRSLPMVTAESWLAVFMTSVMLAANMMEKSQSTKAMMAAARQSAAKFLKNPMPMCLVSSAPSKAMGTGATMSMM